MPKTARRSSSAALAPEPRLPARERLLAAAEKLFYEEGFNTVGIDRVIEVAGVAKASLYDTFGSKDELIRSYLASRAEVKQAAVAKALALHDTPRDRLLGVFEMLGNSYREPTFRGCAFIKASAEARPGSSVVSVCDAWRQWLHELFAGLARDCGVDDGGLLARQLVMLHDGASVSARMDNDVGAADLARATAAAMLDVALAAASAPAKRRATASA